MQNIFILCWKKNRWSNAHAAKECFVLPPIIKIKIKLWTMDASCGLIQVIWTFHKMQFRSYWPISNFTIYFRTKIAMSSHYYHGNIIIPCYYYSRFIPCRLKNKYKNTDMLQKRHSSMRQYRANLCQLWKI